jgi:hypothetical protein
MLFRFENSKGLDAGYIGIDENDSIFVPSYLFPARQEILKDLMERDNTPFVFHKNQLLIPAKWFVELPIIKRTPHIISIINKMTLAVLEAKSKVEEINKTKEQ